MALNKKPAALASNEFIALADQLSKAALLDLCFDLLCQIKGETEMNTEGVASTTLLEYFAPVAAARGDKMPKPRPRYWTVHYDDGSTLSGVKGFTEGEAWERGRTLNPNHRPVRVS